MYKSEKYFLNVDINVLKKIFQKYQMIGKGNVLVYK